MAEEISNRTLAILLVVAIAISLGGTIVSLNRLAGVGAPVVTGFATDDKGTASVNITSQASITFEINNNSIDWGNGWVNSSQSGTCQMTATSTQAGVDEGSESTACKGDWAGASQGALVIENNGNVNISVMVQVNATATEFLGTGGGFAFIVNESEVGACNATFSLNTTTSGDWFPWPADADTDVPVCMLFDYNDAMDTLDLHLRVNISYQSDLVGQGTTIAEITATGSAIP